MMAISKSQLKMIVKECLIEILSEGMGQASGQLTERLQKSSANKPLPKTPTQSTILQQNAAKTRMQLSSNVLKEVIKRESGGDKIMADILADTAANSLPTMLENDRVKTPLPPSGTVERLVASATPDQLFGEDAASKWAALAFAEPIKK